ncbi:MAG: pyridoxal-dependent decarboxylase [Clostridia bacterium]|nr:pyridoxal-dependent decarboxylase [Clostridia bacterium]
MDKRILKQLSESFGDAFYILDSAQFKKNYAELKWEFANIYPNFNIAYSYKTNYTPKLCKIVNDFGGYAEVVSDMEAKIALKSGVDPYRIIWNGPYKNFKSAEYLLALGVTLNIDSAAETKFIDKLAKENPDKTYNLGIRCNFDIGDGVVSRFGFDIDSAEFKDALALFDKHKNLYFKGLQCHFATRRLETWRPRAEKMLALIDALKIKPDRMDLGGGLFGKMADSLKAQFDGYIPSYKEYAKEAATLFAERYKDENDKPELIIEPGSALVGDCMKFVSKVVNIKNVRGKDIATLLGSIYNINPTLNKKNPPIEIVAMGGKQKDYLDLDFGGFTCIESDYVYRHFNGKLAVGDFAVFGNAGSYSIVLKPPFILPNFPVIELTDNGAKVIKCGETFDDLFKTFVF